jgi:hypothetical protein
MASPQRAPALQDLSRDHAVMLQHAARLLSAASTSPQAGLAASRGFIRYFSESILPHLEEEATFVLPKAEEGIQGRFSMIEEQLRTGVDELRITLMDPSFFRNSLEAVAKVLRLHVGYCEANLFPDVENDLTAQGSAKLLHERTVFRKQKRPLAIGGNWSEPAYLT